MKHIQRQSLIILINSIEQQIASLKSILSLSDERVSKTNASEVYTSQSYTDEADDLLIEQALQFEQDKEEIFLQDLAKQAAQGNLNGTGNVE